MINIATKRTGVKDLVTVTGSLLAGKRFWKGNYMAPEVMVAMLLSGTKTYGKKELNDTLENASLSINFSIDNDYLSFTTTVPKGKEKLFLDILTDILTSSIFPKEEFATVVGRMKASILEASTDPEDVAMRALTRALFPKDTPQHKPSALDLIALMDKLTLAEVVDAHKSLVGLAELNIAVAGDVDTTFWNREVKIFGGKLPKKNHKSILARETLTPKGSSVINIKDKTTTNVFFATAISADVNSRNYLALQCILRVLGGDFISRLMSEVRARLGLTYHIGSKIVGVRKGDTGLLLIDAIFAPSLHDKGVLATEQVIKNLFKSGIKPSELERVRVAIGGEYGVRLANSAGMARELLNCLELGRPLTYIDEYPNLIKTVTMKEVKEVLNLLKNNHFYRVSAGSI
jgi:zinc protease